MKFLVNLGLIIFSISIHSQGLFEYFKLTADGDGPEKFDRIVLDVNWNQWIKTPENINQGIFSFGVSAFLFKDIPLHAKSNFSFAFGIGFDSQNFHHDGQFVFEQDLNGDIYTDLVLLPEDYVFYKNKIAMNYVDVPIEFRIRTMNRTLEDRMKFNFRLYLGFKGGFLVNDHLKITDTESKTKVFNLPNSMLYRYGPTIRIGFNKIAFNAFYSLTTLFEKDTGVALTPYSIGVSWMRF